MKKYLLIVIVGLVLACVSCNNSTTPPKTSVTNYTVSFQTAGGTAIPGKTMPEGATLALGLSEYQPERPGYSFDGWYIQGDTEQTPVTSITVKENITLVAKWLSNVSVTLDLQGGTLSRDPDTSVRPGAVFDAWHVPSLKGSVFLHWYLKGDPYMAKVESIQVYDNITLVALWELGCVVTFELDEGEYYGDDYVTVALYDTFETAEIRPLKDGYVLEGWYYDEDFTRPVPPVITVSRDITLYVKWAPLSDYSHLFGVWEEEREGASSYLLYFDPYGSSTASGNGLIGFYFSGDEIRSFLWTASSVDGKAASLANGTLTIGEGEDANTFTKAQPRILLAGDLSFCKLWEKGEGAVLLSLFESGGGVLEANGRTFFSLGYAVRASNLLLLRKNTDEDGNPLPGEVLLAIPIDTEGKLSGFKTDEVGVGDGGDPFAPF
jgi:uncharacterized repeat protein (TIGR02543 family)